MKTEHVEHLFSYGTLRYEKVQIATFGRKLEGLKDSLPYYRLGKVQITDPEVIAKSGEAVHFIIEYSGNPEDQVHGIVFELSQRELVEADKYEVADYKRVQVELLSGKSAWVYVNVDSCTKELKVNDEKSH